MCCLGIDISVIASETCFNKPLPSNGFTCHIAPSLRVFVPNSLTAYHLSFLPRSVLATSVIGLTFLPVARFFSSSFSSCGVYSSPATLTALVPSGTLISLRSIEVPKHQPFSVRFRCNCGAKLFGVAERPVLPHYRCLLYQIYEWVLQQFRIGPTPP
jgi:hypothetical protein